MGEVDGADPRSHASSLECMPTVVVVSWRRKWRDRRRRAALGLQRFCAVPDGRRLAGTIQLGHACNASRRDLIPWRHNETHACGAEFYFIGREVLRERLRVEAAAFFRPRGGGRLLLFLT